MKNLWSLFCIHLIMQYSMMMCSHWGDIVSHKIGLLLLMIQEQCEKRCLWTIFSCVPKFTCSYQGKTIKKFRLISPKSIWTGCPEHVTCYECASFVDHFSGKAVQHMNYRFICFMQNCYYLNVVSCLRPLIDFATHAFLLYMRVDYCKKCIKIEWGIKLCACVLFIHMYIYTLVDCVLITE